MDYLNCEHPIRVYNKYLDEYVWTACNKCNACRRRRANRWIARLENERRCHLFCFFVTLTYDDNHLPILCNITGVPFQLDDMRHDVSISVSDLVFLSTADKQFFQDRMTHFRGIPYANFQDIQKFNKRLNKFFYGKSKAYQNFRYFVCSEYGSTTFRPHFHAIYFVDKQSVANSFAEGVCTCWKNGRCDVQSVQSTATSYVAQYINELFDLPSFYEHPVLRPKFVCSKRPPIGAFNDSSEDYKKIFFSGLSTRLVVDSKDTTKVTSVPLLPCVKNRLYPKVRGFGTISDSLRVKVYGLASRYFDEGLPYLRTFEDYKYAVRCIISSRSQLCPNTELCDYLYQVAKHFTDSGINALKRLFYASRRVIINSFNFGISLSDYVGRIVRFYDDCEYAMLKEFYSYQERNIQNVEDSVYLYPEYCHINNPSNWMDLSCFGLPVLFDVPLFSNLVRSNEILYKKSVKTHFKNAYFDRLRDKNSFLFNLIQKYHAKKCNETDEACC